jgi:hypothetical protein
LIHASSQETVKLRGKFRQSLHLLKSYQQRLGCAGMGGQLEVSAAQPRPPESASEVSVTHETTGRSLPSFHVDPVAAPRVTAAAPSNDVGMVAVATLRPTETTSQGDVIPDGNPSAAEAPPSRLQVRLAGACGVGALFVPHRLRDGLGSIDSNGSSRFRNYRLPRSGSEGLALAASDALSALVLRPWRRFGSTSRGPLQLTISELRRWRLPRRIDC